MRVFRHHRGSLAESLATTIEVKDLADMQRKILEYWASHAMFYNISYCSNIRIENKPVKDDRLPPEWNGVSYYVIADFADGGSGCIGMCNFYEN